MVYITLVDLQLNWLNWFHFLILEGGLLAILIDYMTFLLSSFLDVTRSTVFFFNWDSPHARLNSHYEAWCYKKKSTKKIIGYRKTV